MEDNNNNEEQRRERRPSHGPARGATEKPKNLKNAITRLKKSLRKYYVWIIFAIILSSFSSVLAIIGPNKLSDLTDEIQKGLIVNKDEVTKIAKECQTNINDSTIDGVFVSKEDKIKFITLYTNLGDKTQASEMYEKIEQLPESIKNLIKPKIDKNVIKNIAIFLTIIYVLSALFDFMQSFIMADVANNYARELRDNISKKINKLPLKYFDKSSIGDLLSRVTNDVDTVGVAMHGSLTALIGDTTLVIGSVIMMFYTNWIMALSGIGSSLLGFVAMFIIIGKSQKYFTMRQNELGKLNGHIEEVYRNLFIVKTYNGLKKENKEFDEHNKAVYVANKKSQFLSGLMQPIMNFIGNLSYVVVCVVGAILTINGKIQFGTIVAFIIYMRLFSNPLSQMAQGAQELQTAAAASERVFEILDEKEMPEEKTTDKIDIKNVVGNIEFDHVKFGYDESKLIIKDFSCNIKKGQKIAIVGPTGAGKTTLVNLLMKFYDINEGSIKIDGINIKDISKQNLRDLFIMVLQDTWLFNGTVRDNIKYNKENVSDEQIWKDLKTVGISHFVKSLPGELDYVLSDNDGGISAGQKQLLTIARGMVKDSPFLILDEATSSVDTRTEELVQKAMDKLTEGRTSFIIAHRLSTIKNADLILVMNEGNIIEQGNHEQLMKQNGFYSDLYNSQFKKSTREVIEEE